MNDLIVATKATYTTDGSLADRRRRIVRGMMDSDKILKAQSVEKAIEYFKSQVRYVSAVEAFECFNINGTDYDSAYFKG